MFKKSFKKIFIRVTILFFIFLVKTIYDVQFSIEDFRQGSLIATVPQVLDREGNPLSNSYLNKFNTSDTLPLYEIPEPIQNAFVVSEDKRFYEHFGIDFLAKANSIYLTLFSNAEIRGASTITEQVVRILRPRERTLWSKWIECVEAIILETQVSKSEILEFYLNQVPFASNRKGISQAARYYFDRALSTLGTKEYLTLAVLIRAPTKFDLKKQQVNIEESVVRLAEKLETLGFLEKGKSLDLIKIPLTIASPSLNLEAPQFIQYVRDSNSKNSYKVEAKIKTTLNPELQILTDDLLVNRLLSLKSKKLSNAAALIVDHSSHEILAWSSIGLGCRENKNLAGCKLDMVVTPRQPGSSLKPFLYAAALEKGWTAATLIDDSPIAETVGTGLHRFNNYSRIHYGKITLRNALGNSLNIPAIHAIEFVGTSSYLEKLHSLGFVNLSKSSDFYDHGLALGSGEVSLFEIVRAYSTLANKGIYSELKYDLNTDSPQINKVVFSPEVSSLIGNILSDPWARSLEFGGNNVLNFPQATAVKTGTSTDYRDSWAIGYNSKFVVGIWMGNVDYSPTDGVTGSTGPALVLRSIFNSLAFQYNSGPLYLSPKLIKKEICSLQKHGSEEINKQVDCELKTEYFIESNILDSQINSSDLAIEEQEQIKYKIAKPSSNLEMAFNPRVPAEKQAFEMKIFPEVISREVEWYVDGSLVNKSQGGTYIWPVVRGRHSVQAGILAEGGKVFKTEAVEFIVK